LPKLRVGAVQPSPHQMRPHVALREDPLHGRPADRRHDPVGGGLLSHLLDGPRDRDVLGLPAAVRPGVLLPDRLTRQRDDLAARYPPRRLNVQEYLRNVQRVLRRYERTGPLGWPAVASAKAGRRGGSNLLLAGLIVVLTVSSAPLALFHTSSSGGES